MLARWFHTRLRAAEQALDDGRLDDALRQVSDAALREDRRAAALCSRISAALLSRARLHAQAGQYADALSDLDRMAPLGDLPGEAVALRERVQRERDLRARRHDEEREAHARAAQDLAAGRLESGRLAIEQLESPQRREELLEELELRVRRLAQLLEDADAALRRNDVALAARYWAEAVQRHGQTRESDRFAVTLAAAARKTLDEMFAAGQLDRYLDLLSATAGLRSVDAQRDEYERLAGLVRQAADCFRQNRYHELREALVRLGALRAAPWLTRVLEGIAGFTAARDALLASPLGALELRSQAGQPLPLGDGHELHATVAARPTSAGPGAALRGGLLMLVDGTGSFLLTAREIVRIGRAGSPNVDVPMPADIRSHHADIVRAGEDYFLEAHGPATVNRKPAQRVLLRDGDRVVLGEHAKFIFRKPSVKSATAVLRVSDRCRLPQDVSHVVLLADTCLVGELPSAHVQLREGTARLVLHLRGGMLWARNAPGMNGAACPLELNKSIELGDVRLTLRAYAQGETSGAVG